MVSSEHDRRTPLLLIIGVAGGVFAYYLDSVNPNTYKLCDTFEHASPSESAGVWKHAQGRSCFTLDARRVPTYVATYRY